MKKPQLPQLPLSSGPEARPQPASEGDGELLEQLRQAVMRLPLSDLTNEGFCRKYPQLHFTLRTAYGSYYAATTALLKSLAGRAVSDVDLVQELVRWYQSGEPMGLDQLLASKPQFAVALIERFGSWDAALAAAHLDVSLASVDRRAGGDELASRAYAEFGFPLGGLDEERLQSVAPLFLAQALACCGSLGGLDGRVVRWLSTRPELWVCYDRNRFARNVLEAVPETSRAVKGRHLPGVQRAAFFCLSRAWGSSEVVTTGPGVPMLVTSGGRLLKLRRTDVPVTAEGAEVGDSIPQLRRGERFVGMVAPEVGLGELLLVTRLGRMKRLAIESLGRMKNDDMQILTLEPDDRLEAASWLPRSPERLVVLTEGGKAVGFEATAVAVRGREARGVFRVALARSSEDRPVAVAGGADAEDLLVLSSDGRVLRCPVAGIPTRQGQARGVNCFGPQVVDAVVARAADGLVLMTRQGRLSRFVVDEIRLTAHGGKGVTGVALSSGDAAIGFAAYARSTVQE